MTSDAAILIAAILFSAILFCFILWMASRSAPSESTRETPLTRDEVLDRELARIHDMCVIGGWNDLDRIAKMQEAVLKRMDKPEGKADE